MLDNQVNQIMAADTRDVGNITRKEIKPDFLLSSFIIISITVLFYSMRI
jgi:hypothetical protein